ncbi:MAG TPA: hypothetical protein VNN73_14270 [Blastocatellia bacterium]|nr:hypothetical protein [Blastocatellia bacterium]
MIALKLPCTLALSFLSIFLPITLFANAAQEANTTGSGDKAFRDGRQIMWQEPRDIESRDLFYGIGGREGAPDPNGKFTFIKREGPPDDTSEKIVVRDERGRKWTVKFGPEAGAETAATRIIWAVGYHTDQDYFVKRARIEGRGGFEVRNVRFERDDDGFKTTGRWDWNSNHFQNTRELQGLKVLMALINNWDLSSINNKIVQSENDPSKQIYYVADLGASLGTTGSFINRIPIYKDVAVPGSRGDAEAFANHRFIEGVREGEVIFHWNRSFGRDALRGVMVESARWMGDLLARLSDKQLSDAFRAGGFDDEDIAIYVRAIRERIRELQSLK